MRGTVLRLKSFIYDESSAEDDSGEESPNHDTWRAKKKLSAISPMEVEASQDVNKNLLMSKLELQSASSAGRREKHSNVDIRSPLKSPVFDWDHEWMWKAMSRHRLFSKYMELQSQLHKLYDEIQLDCKKDILWSNFFMLALCEKALASLVKESADSPIETTSFIVETKNAVESPPKKRGRPLKKRPGRPRKYPLASTASTTEWNNEVTSVTPKQQTRKCRDELFLARKPSWICQNCAKRFSSSGWLDRHKSVCSFSKLPQLDTSLGSHKEDSSQTPSSVLISSQDSSPSEVIEKLSEQKYLEGNSSNHSFKVERPDSPLPFAYQNNILSVSPLQPKMDNHNGTEDDESSKKSSFDEESGCTDGEISPIFCRSCKKSFVSQDNLKNHWEEHPDCQLYASIHESDRDSADYSCDSSVSACKHCGKAFRRHKLLKRHQSICHVKSKKKLYQCAHCFKAFSRQMHHQEHERQCSSKGKHFGRKAQRCENCSLLFPTVKKLHKHQVICCPDSNNHMMKLLKCLKCSLVFPNYKKQLKHRAVCCPDSDTDAMVCCNCSKVLIMPDRMAAHKKKCFKAAFKAAGRFQ